MKCLIWKEPVTNPATIVYKNFTPIPFGAETTTSIHTHHRRTTLHRKMRSKKGHAHQRRHSCLYTISTLHKAIAVNSTQSSSGLTLTSLPAELQYIAYEELFPSACQDRCGDPHCDLAYSKPISKDYANITAILSVNAEVNSQATKAFQNTWPRVVRLCPHPR
jgi:hypothetical protein